MTGFQFIDPPARNRATNLLTGTCNNQFIELGYRYINEPNNNRHIHDLQIRIDGIIANEQLGIDSWMEKSVPGPAPLDIVHPTRPCFLVEHSAGIYLVDLAEETTRFIPYIGQQLIAAWFYLDHLIVLETTGCSIHDLNSHNMFSWDTGRLIDRSYLLDLGFNEEKVEVLVRNVVSQRVQLLKMEMDLSNNPEPILLADLFPDTVFEGKLKYKRENRFFQPNNFNYPAIIDSFRPCYTGKENKFRGVISYYSECLPDGGEWKRTELYDYIELGSFLQ